MGYSLQYLRDKIREEWLYRKAQSHFNPFSIPNTVPSFFIISAGRSGSTLLRKLLMTGRQIHIPPESESNIPNIIKFYINNYQTLDWQEIVIESLEIFQRSNCFKLWNVDLFKNIDSIIDANEEDRTIYKILEYIYGEHRNKYNSQATVIGDKTPYLNLQLKWISLAYKDAKFIHIVRDGRDVIVSRTNNFNESINEASARWITSLDFVKSYLDKSQLLEIKYEELVLSTRTTIKSICNFLEVEYSGKMTELNSMNKLEEESLDHHINLSKEISADRIGIWKKELSDHDKKKINYSLRKHLTRYGYT